MPTRVTLVPASGAVGVRPGWLVVLVGWVAIRLRAWSGL
jgi:hypothetical protein